jgi:hypothetical protein
VAPVLLLVTAYTLLIPLPAYAYIDPATTSYIIQIVSGLIISLSVAFGIYFRKLQMSLVTWRARMSAWLVRLSTRKPDQQTAGRTARAARAGKAGKAGKFAEAARDARGESILQPPEPIKTHRQLSLEAMQRAVASGSAVGGVATGGVAFVGADAGSSAGQGAGSGFGAGSGSGFGAGSGASAGAGAASGSGAGQPTYRSTRPFNKSQFLFADGRRFRERLLMAALIAAGIAFTLVVFGCIDLFVTNRVLFAYSLLDILPAILGLFVLLTVVLAALMLVWRGRVFDLVASLFAGLLVMLYLQGNFLNLDFGVLVGDNFPWQNYAKEAVLNSAVWLVVVLIPLMVRIVSQKVWRGLVLFVPALLIAMQLVGIVSITAGTDVFSRPPEEAYLAEDGLYELGSEQNIVIISIDSIDQRYVNELLTAEPDFFDGKLDGFTRFNNNINHYAATYPSVLDMLTGQRYEPGLPKEQFVNQTWEQSTFLPELHAGGYKVALGLNDPENLPDANVVAGYVDNVKTGALYVNQTMAVRRLVRLSCFRYLPHVFKSSLWMSTDSFTQDAYHRDGFDDKDDIFYRQLTTVGLHVGDSPRHFTFFHLRGVHEPYIFDENFQPISDSSQVSAAQVTKADFTLVFEFLDQMRALGLYDNACIIITGDHGVSSAGRNASLQRGMSDPLVTALFVKPAGSHGTPLQQNSAPVSTDNLHATVLKNAGLDASSWPPDYFAVPEDADIVRDYYWINKSPRGWQLDIMEVRGDANDFKNWKRVGEMEVT